MFGLFVTKVGTLNARLSLHQPLLISSMQFGMLEIKPGLMIKLVIGEARFLSSFETLLLQVTSPGLSRVSYMNFVVSHVYREGNCCADLLANIGLSLSHLKIWMDLPNCIKGVFVKDRLGMPNYRFVNP